MDDIVSIQSSEGETIKIKRVKALGTSVEKWLQHLQESVAQTVKKSIKEAYLGYKEENEDFKRHRWVMEDYTAQAISVVGSIIWCATTESLLRSDYDEDIQDSLHWWLTENVSQLKELTKLIQGSGLCDRKRKALVALITQDVHYRDISDTLLKKALHYGITEKDYIWQ